MVLRKRLEILMMCLVGAPNSAAKKVRWLVLAVLWVMFGWEVWAAEPPGTGPLNPKPVENPGVRIAKITETTYECGKVRIDSASRTLRFAAEVNGEEGPLEYALVTHSGAKHESLLVTDVDPVEIHTAALLLGASPSFAGGNRAPPQTPSAGPVSAESLRTAAAPSGKKIEIWVRYQKAEKVFRTRLESCLEWRDGMNSERKLGVPQTPWLYTGSYVFEGGFAAKDEGNLFSLIICNEALVNIPLPQNRDDRTWFPRGETLPPRGTPVVVEVTFLP